jgi:hypothetical protein
MQPEPVVDALVKDAAKLRVSIDQRNLGALRSCRCGRSQSGWSSTDHCNIEFSDLLSHVSPQSAVRRTPGTMAHAGQNHPVPTHAPLAESPPCGVGSTPRYTGPLSPDSDT